MNGARCTKGIPRVSARTIKVHAVTLGAGSTAQNAIYVHTVYRDETVDMNSALVEEVLGTAQVAITFLTNTAHKQDIANRLNLEFLKGAQHLQNGSQPASIITDTGS